MCVTDYLYLAKGVDKNPLLQTDIGYKQSIASEKTRWSVQSWFCLEKYCTTESRSVAHNMKALKKEKMTIFVDAFS